MTSALLHVTIPPSSPSLPYQLAADSGTGGVNENGFDLPPPKKSKVGTKYQSAFIQKLITKCDKQLNSPLDTNEEGLPRDSPLALDSRKNDDMPDGATANAKCADGWVGKYCEHKVVGHSLWAKVVATGNATPRNAGASAPRALEVPGALQANSNAFPTSGGQFKVN